MEVHKIPLSGCSQILLSILTLGVAPLSIWLNERNWPRFMDEQGLITRGGQRMDWTDFNKITKIITEVNTGSVRTEKYELRHPQGKVDVVIYRLENGSQVFDYIWDHLPELTRNPQQ